MNFTDAAKVLQTIRSGDEAERVRGINRQRVNDLFNSVPPLTEEQAKKWNLRVNVSFGEGPVLAANGRRQYDSAFLGPQNFFKVRIPDAPPEKRTEWEMQITRFINKPLKDSEEYTCVHEYKWASVLAHGIGAQIWHDDECVIPEYVAVEDLRVPTDTLTSLKNLIWFAVRHQYTINELSRKVFGPHADKGWNKKVIAEALDKLKDVNFQNVPYTWMTSPEKMAELVKQNAGFYSSDATPTLTFWHFYYQDAENPRSTDWYLCVVADNDGGGPATVNSEVFLYESDKPVSKKRKNLLHIQFGDLNNKAPFMYHSVRSLGFLLVEPCYWTNLARCRFLQHVFEQFNIWLRSADPGGRARAQAVQLVDRAFIPEGISIVPQAERHQIKQEVFESAMAQLKLLMSEASQSYVQSTDTGTKKEQTAFETRVKLEAVNAMMSGLLGRAFRKEKYAYQEIARRMCLRKTQDPDAREFQDKCRKAGIPRLFVNVDMWEIEPEMPMGAGNPTMAQTQAQQLLAMRPMFDPTAQQEILHEATEVITGDPRRADRWAPIDGKRGVTDAERDSEFAFGTLMQGVPVRMKEGISPLEQIETLIGLLAGKIAQLEKIGGMASRQEIIGLQTVVTYVTNLIQLLAQDEQQQARVKSYMDAIGKLQNAIKGFAQRLAQQNGKANGNGVGQDELHAKTIKASADAGIKERKATQQMRHKEESFQSEQQCLDAAALAEQHREGLRTGAEAVRAANEPESPAE